MTTRGCTYRYPMAPPPFQKWTGTQKIAKTITGRWIQATWTKASTTISTLTTPDSNLTTETTAIRSCQIYQRFRASSIWETTCKKLLMNSKSLVSTRNNQPGTFHFRPKFSIRYCKVPKRSLQTRRRCKLRIPQRSLWKANKKMKINCLIMERWTTRRSESRLVTQGTKILIMIRIGITNLSLFWSQIRT
jgi:hypothetical protein